MARYLTLCLALMLCFVLDFISLAQDIIIALHYDDNPCGKALPPGRALGSVTNLTIISGGIERSYLLFIPPKHNITSENYVPLIISYHGGTKTSLDQLQLDQFTNPEFNEEAIVAYPQGINVKLYCKASNFLVC
jgi:poly(3-hydroxybutyrate) depolymerase